MLWYSVVAERPPVTVLDDVMASIDALRLAIDALQSIQDTVTDAPSELRLIASRALVAINARMLP